MKKNKYSDALDIIIDALSSQDYTALQNYEASCPKINQKIQTVESLLQQISNTHQTLLFEQERINHVLFHMAEGFVLIDHHKNILLCNQSVKNFFDCEQDVTAQNISVLVNDKSISQAVGKALEKEQSSMFEMWLHENLILNAYVSPAQKGPLQDNEPAVTIFFVNVTKEKLLEKQKREFFSNASHELKTPITSILGFSEMINHNIIKTEEEKDQVLERIEIEARRMSELISNLLMISNLEAKSKPTEYTDFNLNEVLQEAVSSVSPMNNNEPVQIEVDASDVIVYANRHQLYEMCVNLIENAVKYNKPGGLVSIELKAKKYHVTLKVKDTGIGIPVEHQARVFERFFRVDYGRDKKVGGSGLGLSIVKHIVNMYNGEISLRSKKDIGTTIQVRLPIVRRQEEG